MTAAAPPASRPRRHGTGARTVRGIVRGIVRGSVGGAARWVLACLVVAVIAVLVTPRPSTDVAVAVSYQRDLAALRRIAPYPVIVPNRLPASWQPVSSRLTGRRGGLVSWHLGFVTQSGRFASLEESNERPAEFIRRMTNSGDMLTPVSYRGAQWARRWRPDKDQRSLYHSTPGGPTVVVTGNASWADLGTLLRSLGPLPR